MRGLRDGLAVVLLAAVVLRIAAELVTPALPLVATLLFFVFVCTLIFGGRGPRL